MRLHSLEREKTDQSSTSVVHHKHGKIISLAHYAEIQKTSLPMSVNSSKLQTLSLLSRCSLQGCSQPAAEVIVVGLWEGIDCSRHDFSTSVKTIGGPTGCFPPLAGTHLQAKCDAQTNRSPHPFGLPALSGITLIHTARSTSSEGKLLLRCRATPL